MNGKAALSVILVLLGGWILLRMLGLTDSIMSFLFPVILIGLGWVGLKNDKKYIGGGLVAIGALILLGKLSGLILFLGAVALIYWGVTMFRKRSGRAYID
ncbi:hypothetical protein IDH44_18345 [Paenibacillus sp. IB182496]|uniref:LiaF transmembrane domain-containing protein n=1 Tax=Paenibacillus sabuli TaxID=2772509 RepID=A0A927BXB8_9BACL|nr:hypothetical protein [Paenibacillus sabuli]MBD2847164.1 hypothetical protein [Paenibacillus sabuli]